MTGKSSFSSTRDVNLFRESAGVLKTDDQFKCYRLETTGGGVYTHYLDIDASSGYGIIEISGPSGAFIDLKKDPEGDFDLRFIADGSPRIETDDNNDLYLAPHGTGKVKFGTYVGSALSITGYITIKDAGGTSRNLAVVA